MSSIPGSIAAVVAFSLPIVIKASSPDATVRSLNQYCRVEFSESHQRTILEDAAPPAEPPVPHHPVHPPVHQMLWSAIYPDVDLCDLPPVPRSPTYFDHHTHSYFFGEREADAAC